MTARREGLAAIGELAAVLAHEVRNPLTSIRIDLQHVEERLPPGSPLRASLERALREVQRLDQTVNGVLRIARSGAIGSDLVDLRAPLRRALEVAACAFEQSEASLGRIRIGARPVPVRGDEPALEQLFLNLLLNAAQAVGRGGHASVRMTTGGSGTRVDIRDSGPGIPAEQLGKLFEPFFTTRRDGTGLGLPVARQIVHAHGGSIDIASSTVAGTTVSVRLPLASPSREVASGPGK